MFAYTPGMRLHGRGSPHGGAVDPTSAGEIGGILLCLGWETGESSRGTTACNGGDPVGSLEIQR